MAEGRVRTPAPMTAKRGEERGGSEERRGEEVGEERKKGGGGGEGRREVGVRRGEGRR